MTNASLNYIKLYEKKSDVNEIYLIEKGKACFYLSENDKYCITGNKILIGASEIILNNLLSYSIKRLETCVISEESKIKKISLEKFMEGIEKNSFLLNNCIVISKQISLLNNIISKNNKLLSGGEKEIEDYCIQIYGIIEKTKNEYNQRKFPWLKEIIDDYIETLSYKKGEALAKTSSIIKLTPPEELSKNSTEYPPGSVLCKQGDDSYDMYILNSGSIDIIIDGNRVTSIKEPGTPLGEISLFIGEKRSATLKTSSYTTVTKISRQELSNSNQEDKVLLNQLLRSLAQKYYNSIIKLEQINERLIEKNLADTSEKRIKIMMKKNTIISQLSALKKNINQLYETYNQDFIKNLIEIKKEIS